jgi:hypothetical protein
MKKSSSQRINSKSGFADPDKIKSQRPLDKPIDGKPNLCGWDFSCPQYDQRSSNFINAGTSYGVGINQPVGHFGNPKERVDVLPFGRPTTMRVDEKA